MFDAMINAFNSLDKPNVTGNMNPENLFVALRINSSREDFIAKDHKGQPVFLLGIQSRVNRLAPIRLEHVIIESGLHCHIRQANDTRIEGMFTVIRCVNASFELQRYFLYSLLPIVLSLPANRDAEDISNAICAILELFRAITLPAQKSVQGLWAELFVISKAIKPEVLIRAWHNNPEDRFDFNAGIERIEVKSSTGSRVHHFSLEQLNPPKDTKVVIASLIVQPSSGGENIFDLIELICLRVSDVNILSRLTEVVVRTLGDKYQYAIDLRYDFEVTDGSMAFYYALDVPCITMPLPIGVSDVHFKSDLSIINPISSNTKFSSEGLFNSIIRL